MTDLETGVTVLNLESCSSEQNHFLNDGRPQKIVKRGVM